jgi:hypothetical protein
VKTICAIKIQGTWFVATPVPAKAFGLPDDGREQWSELRTTAWLGAVGEEAKCIDLERDE